ncbi:hypothetical protein KRP22_014836 [Phytophthora ramorum]|uniref:uncharacterized protein n=1 Tax=Phytophthora ramorum TaxID=164328 RepID=UPI003095A726|nr:hypothetical protein KRP23_11811 [Phytophthora ramorum]KAH7465835.1 hypothetical protein KRP23_11812 [Phytophthora ramorum]KAH7496215.1 hypothetical protein KRP22_14109 [Phytophthora ramorum]KAH7496216.1 hypothetical protein KRP22_14110 [Phytophthora ramorum]
MRLHHLLLIVFVLTFVVQIEAVSKPLDATRPLTADQIRSPIRRLLRRQADSVGHTETLAEDEEERFGVKDAAKMLSTAVEMKTKMKYWLFREITPGTVLDKLKVTSATDKNYKYFSTYFFKYYGRNPSARPSDLPPHTTDGIMMMRMRNWLEQTRTPPQVFTDLGFKGTFASARGMPGYQYFEQYSTMWSNLQAKLSPDEIILPILRPGP